jgi:internalin A
MLLLADTEGREHMNRREVSEPDPGTRVVLQQHGLISVPEELKDSTALTALDLSQNQLTVLPEWIGDLIGLTNLNLSVNRLASLPESLGNLTRLTTLYLSGNQLAVLPEWIGNLTDLKELYLGRNQLAVLPEWIGNLTALRRLNVSGNMLTALPESIGNLTALTTLDVFRNQLTALPESIGNLTALTTLDVLGNQLTALPESIGNLTALTTLDASQNQLAALPKSLRNLTALTTLDVSGNQLSRLPMQLADHLSRGVKLGLEGNPLDDPLPELVARGTNALVAYLRSLEDAIPQYEAKLLLVGEGNVGKSSLIAALRGAPFVRDRPTTHGIEISPLRLRNPTINVDMTLRTWDFGGQEVYRVTHQFFFSRRALYVVVWNAREGQERNEVEDWLRRIRLRVGLDAQTMIVATHCADRLPELDYPYLEQAFRGMLVGSFAVDNLTKVGLAGLREAIGREAAQLPQMGQLISPRWVAARDEILARAQAEPQIRYEQFVEVCERHGVTGDEIITLSELMHDLGQVIYYSEDEGLRDIIVLNPEWLTKAISYVLEDQATRDADGVLNHTRLRQIWQERDDGPAYPARYHPYFLRLMEKFDISYRLENDERHSLVAQLVQHKRPENLPWQFGTQPPAGIRVLAMVCRLSEPAPGLVSWLTVRHHRASTDMHWRRGIFLRHPVPAYASEALLELRHNGELAVEVRAPSPDLYFNVLRDSIEDLITRRWPGLTYQLLVPCPAKAANGSMCTGQFPLDGLLRLREGGIVSIPCMECTKEHEISLLLTGFTIPDRSLGVELDQMYAQLARIENGIIRAEGQAAETADYMRRVLRIVSTEITDCPRLFTLAPERPTGSRLVRFYQNHYRLTLWCEQPGYWHPWVPASYEVDLPKEWFVKISPYVMLIFRTLQLVVPLAGSIAVASLPKDQLEVAQAHLEMMKTVVADLPGKLGQDLSEVGLGDAKGQLIATEGQALRLLRSVLFEYDPPRAFGGLSRVQALSGEFLWVCAEHYPEYDPGLPTIP